MTDDDLLRYLDGELSPREAREVEQELSRSEESRNKLAAMRQLGEAVAAHFEAETDEAAPALSASWQKIAAQLPSETPPSGLWVRVREWFDAYRGHVLTGTLAAAAGAFLALWLRGPGGPEVPAPTALAVGEPAEVESLEVEGGSGTIFQIPSDDQSLPTTVIWVTPSEPDGDEEAVPL